MNYLKHHALTDPTQYSQPRGMYLSDLVASQKLQDLTVEVLLLQSGYLTIKKLLMPGYVEIGLPNKEVATSLAQLYRMP